MDYAEEARHVLDWQFLSLAPERMGLPVPQQRTGGGVRLARDGSNIADYLLDIRRLDPNALDGIVETMAYVLPYARDLQPSVTSELERKAYLQLTEADFKVPGWMLSTGTLRLLALLALLRHPQPPPLIVVEEVENGLDPRSTHLIVEEIRNAVLDGVTQVILTTHSPYLLDLLTLEHLVLVERNAKGQPRFLRPADNENLQRWGADFAPGKLYTMGSLSEVKP
jgi:predicted ATPase